MTTASHGSVTRLLGQIGAGDDRARDRLFEVVYSELRRLAGNFMRGERADHTLEPTALVHEACLQLLDPGLLERAEGRSYLFGAAAQAMQRILVDHARKRAAAKRGGDHKRVALDDAVDAVEGRLRVDILALDEALEKLASLSPRQLSLIQLKFFGGLEMKEIAEVLGVSLSTVEQDWRLARAWLHKELSA